MTTIGFFGDSFCSDFENRHSIDHDYETYIKKLKNHYNADIVNMGVAGSNVWDPILLQFKPFENNPPDIAIFVWTHIANIFHRECRNLQYFNMTNPALMSSLYKPNATMMAANQFFEHLFDIEKVTVEYLAALMYFDDTVLSKLNNTKIIHMWGFGKTDFDTAVPEKDELYDNVISYPYTWKHGVELRPALMAYAYGEQYGEKIADILKKDKRANHIGGNELNEKIFNLIKTAIDSSSQ
jgi:hypothetical protein